MFIGRVFETEPQGIDCYKINAYSGNEIVERWIEKEPTTTEYIANKWLSEMERVRQTRDSQYINSDRLKVKADNLLLDGDTLEAEKVLTERNILKENIKQENPYPIKPDILINETDLLLSLLVNYPNITEDKII